MTLIEFCYKLQKEKVKKELKKPNRDWKTLAFITLKLQDPDAINTKSDIYWRPAIKKEKEMCQSEHILQNL